MNSDCSVNSCSVKRGDAVSCSVENGDIASYEISNMHDLGDDKITVSNNECVFETNIIGGSVMNVDSRVTMCETEVVAVASMCSQYDSISSDQNALRDNVVSIMSKESVSYTCTSSVDACHVLYNDNMNELIGTSSHLNVANRAFSSGTW